MADRRASDRSFVFDTDKDGSFIDQGTFLTSKEKLQEFVNSEANPKLAGSVFINNTSFSGADIKVVINIYDNGKARQKDIQKLTANIEKTAAEILDFQGIASDLSDTLAGLKPGTQEYTGINKLLLNAQAQVKFLQAQNIAMQERIKSLNENPNAPSSKVLAECQTISISTFREKHAVRACGSVYPKGFTRGPRQIGGSLIFTVFNQHVLYEFLEAHASDFDAHVGDTSAMLDQIPPVDISILFANEYGALSQMTIYGVEFTTEGQVMSIEDMLTENTVSFVARDMDPMRSYGKKRTDEVSHRINQEQPVRATDLLKTKEYQELKDKVDPYKTFQQRQNPFI